jgi:hypothetical protein
VGYQCDGYQVLQFINNPKQIFPIDNEQDRFMDITAELTQEMPS